MSSTTMTMTGNWLIEPNAGRMIQAGLAERMRADNVGHDAMPRIWTAANRDAAKTPKSVAVLPLIGIMEPRESDLSYYYGGTSTETFGAMFDRAVADPSVKAVLLDVYSPGGQVYGTPELANKIYNARGSKPIVAIANPMAASAALWVATAADRFYITPSGDAGSHGVYMMHTDFSKALEEAGIKQTIVSAGKYKTEGNPYEPLGEEAKVHFQSEVDEIMGEFTAALASQRGVTATHVRENFGQGRLLSAKHSVAAGMCDGIATFDQIVARLLSGHIHTDKASASDDWMTPLQAEYHERRFGNSGDLKRKLAVARR